MLMKFQTNIFVFISRNAVLLAGLLFFSFLSNAQEEKDTTTIIVDTTETMLAPSDEVTEADVSTTENKYFSNRLDTLLIVQRNIPGDVVKKMKGEEDFWYADTDIKQRKSKEQVAYEKEQGQKGQKEKNEQALKEQKRRDDSYTPIGQRSWFQTVLWIVIITVFAIGLIMYLSGSTVGLFRKRNVMVPDEGDDIITEDIFAINYQKEIDKAAAQGNYRLAIRLLFLRLLKKMSEKNIIRYKQDKTNLDYLLELHPTGYYKNFFRITRNYEYSWYGQFNVSEDAYKVIRSEFDQFDSALK